MPSPHHDLSYNAYRTRAKNFRGSLDCPYPDYKSWWSTREDSTQYIMKTYALGHLFVLPGLHRIWFFHELLWDSEITHLQEIRETFRADIDKTGNDFILSDEWIKLEEGKLLPEAMPSVRPLTGDFMILDKTGRRAVQLLTDTQMEAWVKGDGTSEAEIIEGWLECHYPEIRFEVYPTSNLNAIRANNLMLLLMPLSRDPSFFPEEAKEWFLKRWAMQDASITGIAREAGERFHFSTVDGITLARHLMRTRQIPVDLDTAPICLTDLPKRNLSVPAVSLDSEIDSLQEADSAPHLQGSARDEVVEDRILQQIRVGQVFSIKKGVVCPELKETGGTLFRITLIGQQNDSQTRKQAGLPSLSDLIHSKAVYLIPLNSRNDKATSFPVPFLQFAELISLGVLTPAPDPFHPHATPTHDEMANHDLWFPPLLERSGSLNQDRILSREGRNQFVDEMAEYLALRKNKEKEAVKPIVRRLLTRYDRSGHMDESLYGDLHLRGRKGPVKRFLKEQLDEEEKKRRKARKKDVPLTDSTEAPEGGTI
ncbi:MAG: hypothetical protein IJ083_10325 [Clostridia bacterium]|nr:hypothetical protein [Clostridia bacterium]